MGGELILIRDVFTSVLKRVWIIRGNIYQGHFFPIMFPTNGYEIFMKFYSGSFVIAFRGFSVK